MPTIESMFVSPTPVDLRLWVHEVTLGWKTVAQAQAELDAEPSSRTACRVRALAMVPGVVEQVIRELRAESYGSIVLLTQYRDVIVMAQKQFREQSAIRAESLYPGTPLPKREKLLARFHTDLVPVLVLYLKEAHTIGDVHGQEWLWIDGVENTLLEGELPGRVRRVVAEGPR